MTEVRCSACKALLFEIDRHTVVIKGKSTIEIKPAERVKAKCKCGKTNFITVRQEADIYSNHN